MSFSVIDHALTFDEVVAKVTSNAATLNKLIGRVLGVGRGERNGFKNELK